MTYTERIDRALNDSALDPDEPAYINRLILMAYYLGKTRVARAVCDQHSAQLRAVRDKARALRYHNMAEAILPHSNLIYHPDYSGDYIETFGSDPYPEVD